MKTTSLTFPTHGFIDTAPLAARYDVLAKAVLAFVTAGRLGHALRTSRKILRLIRTLTKLEAHNAQLKRKMDMLSHKPWRDCVLRELGGLRKLKLWEAAYARSLRRAAAPKQAPKPQEPAWLYTAERMAESEQLKARARKCARAGHHPLIMRDHYKMDFAGEFRLAPLPRGERAARQMKVYTQESIVDYDYNPVPFAKKDGFGPASVWPVEFYAAIAIEARILGEREDEIDLPGHSRAHRELGRSSFREPELPSSSNVRPSASHCISPSEIQTVRNDKAESYELQDEDTRHQRPSYKALQPLPLKAVLSPKAYRDLF